jgi:outer membrane protein assembly factor BamE (lipoprotein component of BamABCDE complex)
MKTDLVPFRKFAIAAGLLATIALSGCATPEARIQKNPELFAGLAPSDQQAIKEGRASLGFTPEMVRLALGDPDRVTTRTDASGSSEVWRYTTYETDGGVYLYRGYYHRYYCHGDPFFPFYLNYTGRRDRDYLKLTFTGGRVSAIEEEK